MKTLFLDCFAGIAGDMTVAALVHAGADLDGVLREVRKVGVHGWSARVERVTRGPFAATRFVVEEPHHDHGHHHADWRSIREALQPLPERIRDRAVRTFQRLAEAEARVHGMAADDVAFHEVGATDSIVDIVAACAAMELLDVGRVVATALPMGQGRVRSAHGILPLPAPAVVEVLRGFPVVPSPWSGELVTPTGAALVAALAEPGPMPAMRIERVGYGAGTRDPPDHANVLRVVIGEGDPGAVNEVDELRAQVDDLPGEAVPLLIEALFAAGALDVWVTPVVMKKGRPGLLVGALAEPDRRVSVGDALLRHAGTFGYRWDRLQREVLGRRHETVTTPWGEVRVKLGEREGALVHVAPEYEDCAALARSAGVPLAAVTGAALAAWRSR